MEESTRKVVFHHPYGRFHFPCRTALKTFLEIEAMKRGFDVDTINYVFCTDAYLLELNKSYLRHDTLTDIITFELSGRGDPLVADIYISVDRVAENAILFKVGFQLELHRVIFHGLLHLFGLKDKTRVEARAMRMAEADLLQRYFISRGTFPKV